MGRLFYQFVLTLATLVAGPVLLSRRRRHYESSIRERLGLRPLPGTAGKQHLWIHAVSVGEVGVAATLVPHLPQTLPLLVTTVTPTGQATARSRFPKATVAYLPFDLGLIVRRFFGHFQPRLLLLTEGDLWPTVLHHAKSRSVPTLVINGRVSDRSFKRMRRFRRFLSPLFGPVDRFGMQTEADRLRLLDLGVPAAKVTVTGNLKFDSPEPELAPGFAGLVRELAGDRPILIAGSTMPGEEEQVLESFKMLGAGDRALLVIAPRHPERWDEVGELLSASSLPWIRRSRAGSRKGETPAVVLLDSLGELAALYRLAASAFIGGTLAPTGGHNPLEAACFAVPVVVGPSMENFREIEEAFDDASAWTRVESAKQLSACWSEWLDRPETGQEIGRRGRHLIDQHRGALARTLELIRPWLPGPKEPA